MIKGLLSVIMLYATLLCTAGAAHADTYMYENDEGIVTLTDDIGKVPHKYRGVMNTLKDEDVKTHGYVPTLTEALNGNNDSNEDWYDYDAMPFYTRWILLAKAGSFDLGPTLKSMYVFITLSMVALGGLWFFIFHVFEQRKWKGLFMFLVLGGIFCTVFFRFLGAVEDRSEQVAGAVSKATKISKESREELMGLLKSLKDEGDLGIDLEKTIPGMTNLPSGKKKTLTENN